MKTIICTCDNKELDAKQIRVFLNSRKEISDVKIYEELCELQDIKEAIDTKSNQKETIIAACPKLSDIKTKSSSLIELKKKKNLVYSVNSDKITDKVKRMLKEKITELKKTKTPEAKDEVNKKNTLCMEPGFGSGKDKYLKINRSNCPSTEKWRCDVCKEACPQDSFYDQKLVVDKKKCMICGICSNSCPLNLISYRPKKDLKSSMNSVLSQEESQTKLRGLRSNSNQLNQIIIVFSCNKDPKKVLKIIGEKNLNYPTEVIPIYVSCISEISLKDILEVFIENGQGTLILGCEDCFNDSQKYIINLLKKFKEVFKNTELKDRVKFIETSGRDYKEINREINDFATKTLSKTKLDMGFSNKQIKDEPLEHYNTNKRKKTIHYLNKLAKQFNVSKENLKNISSFHVPKIDLDKCSNCGECSDICSTEAIQEKDDIFVIQEWKCVDCGKCTQICSQNAIKIEEKLPAIKNTYITP